VLLCRFWNKKNLLTYFELQPPRRSSMYPTNFFLQNQGPLPPCTFWSYDAWESCEMCEFIGCRWNQLDLAIVVLSVAGIVLEEMDAGVIPINPTIIRVMRVLRIARGTCAASALCRFYLRRLNVKNSYPQNMKLRPEPSRHNRHSLEWRYWITSGFQSISANSIVSITF